jgi:glutathione S-transferase
VGRLDADLPVGGYPVAKVTLFSARACPFAHRTRLVLAEKKVDFELVEIDLQNKPARFLSVSGYGKVPAIEHEGNHIWESAVVNEYLDEVFPRPALLPTDAAKRAVARIWIDWANTRFVSTFGALLRAQNASEQASAHRDLGEHLAHFEREGLAKFAGQGPFFFGDRPTLVDFTLSRWCAGCPPPHHYRAVSIPSEHERIARWRSALAKLDAVRGESNAASYYVERYARHAAPAKQAQA